MSAKVGGKVVIEQDHQPRLIALAFEWGKPVEGQPEHDISVIREIPMGMFLAVCGNFFLAELPIEGAVEDIGDIPGSPCLTVRVSVGHLLHGGLIEEERNETRDNW